jgi:cellulose synthase/poly-beta-1,6-N-acetylglucosamine synthase-like glycosyltransferase
MPPFFDGLYALIWLAEVSALLYIGYRCLLGIFSLRRRKPAALGFGDTNFLLLVAAHDEEAVIADTVACLRGLDYPPEKLSIVVVADDCSDATGQIAKAAGAGVLFKRGPATGKGAVIHWALIQREIQEAQWDALVLLDADSRPGPQTLRYLDGAVVGGSKAIQSRAESTAEMGWVARGYAFNNSQRNRVWHQAREMAGFSAALTGTGICLTRDLLDAVPPVTRTLTEDLEYSAILTKMGIRVRYLYDAVIDIEQPHSLRSSVRQRLRWARGQIRTTIAHGPGLLWRGLTKRDFSAFDTALYLALPSLVPFQALILVCGTATLLAPRRWYGMVAGLPVIPEGLLFGAFGLTILLAYAGVTAEHRRANWRDWLAFLALMASWLPIAVFAAMTTSVRSWYRTPHGLPGAGGAPISAGGRDSEELQPSVPSGTPS